MDTASLRHDAVAQRFTHNHAFIIGIDAYVNVTRLQTAVNDAEALADVLGAQQHFTVHPPLLDATGAELRALLHEVLPARVGADDRVLFYFAGHGIAADGDDGPAGYLVPADADPMDTGTFLPMSDLQLALESLPCRHMLLILDCCFSGAFRWSSNHRSLGSMAPKRIYKERYDRFLEDPAWQVITSAAYDQKAMDVLAGTATGARGLDGRRGAQAHSPFALALFDGLAGMADVIVGREGDGVITATELYSFIRDRVEPQTQAASRSMRQTPGFFPLRKHDKGEFIFANPGHRLNLEPIPNRSPYMGLASFDEGDRALFYGRERVVAGLRETLGSRRLLVVTGASGTGKSSVVKAGLLPQLRDEGHHILPVVRPGKEPLLALQRALEAIALPATGAGLAVLLIDQFEELVTRCGDPVVRLEFLARLRALVDDTARIHRVLISVRSDFEPQLLDGPLAELWHLGRVVVPPFSLEELREVIVLPTLQEVLVFEPAELVDEIIGEVVQSAGALPLLSYTLNELYEAYRSSGRSDRALLKADYDRLGGVSGALSKSADRLHEALPAAEQAILRKVMLRMVAPEGDRASRRVAVPDLHYPDTPQQSVDGVLDALVNARLVVKGQAGGQGYVEPAHDALVRSWKMLGRWIDEVGVEAMIAIDKVGAAASEYLSAGAKPALLWDDNPRLPLLLASVAAPAHLFSVAETAFIRASEQRRTRLLWRTRGIVAAVVLALAGLALVAWDRAREAEATLRSARIGAQGLQDTSSLLSQYLQLMPDSVDLRRMLVSRSHSLNRDLGARDDIAAQKDSAAFWRHVQDGDAARHAPDRARTMLDAAEDIARDRAASNPDDVEWQLNLALALARKAGLEQDKGAYDKGRPLYIEAIGIHERIDAGDHGLVQLAVAHAMLGHMEVDADNHALAEQSFARAAGIHERLSPSEQESAFWLAERSSYLASLASALEAQAASDSTVARMKLAEMGVALQRALKVAERRVRLDGTDVEAHRALAMVHLEIAKWHLRQQSPSFEVVVKMHLEASERSAGRLVAGRNTSLADNLRYVAMRIDIAKVMSARPELARDVIRTYRDVVRRLDALEVSDPVADGRRASLFELQFGLGELLREYATSDAADVQRDAIAGARSSYRRAIALAEGDRTWASKPEHAARLAGLLHAAGVLELEHGAPEVAGRQFKAAVEIAEDLYRSAPTLHREALVVYYMSVGEAEQKMMHPPHLGIDWFLRARALLALLDEDLRQIYVPQIEAAIAKSQAQRPRRSRATER